MDYVIFGNLNILLDFVLSVLFKKNHAFMLYRQHQVRRHCSLETEAFYDSFFKSIQQRFEETPNIKDAKKSYFLKESFIHLFYKDKIFSVFSQYCVKVKTLFNVMSLLKDKAQ